MVSIEAGTIWIKRNVQYADPQGTMKVISAGMHRIIPVEMKDIMDDEVELESWIIREGEGTERQKDYVVDCNTVEQWLADGDIEIS